MRRLAALRGGAGGQERLAGQLPAVLRAATRHAIMATDLSGRVTLFSEGAERMFGWSSAELVGRPSPVAFHDADQLRARSAALGPPPLLDAAFPAREGSGREAGGPPDDIWNYARRDGTRFRGRLAVSELLDDGRRTGWIGIVRDVTGEEATRLRLQITESRWRSLLERLPDLAVLVVGSDLRYRLAVGAGLDRQGMAGIEGSTVAETSSPANAEALEAAYRRALAGEPSELELVSSRSQLQTAISVVPFEPVPGEPEVLVVARDVSEIRAREAALRSARDRSEQLFVETPHGTLLTDAGGCVSALNPAMERMLAEVYDDPTVEVIGAPVASVLPAVARDADGRLGELCDWEALVEGRVGRLAGEVELAGVVGELVAVPLRAPGGSADGPGWARGRLRGEDFVMVTVTDISERRLFEQHLTYLADHDPLTGLFNRRRFDEELRAHLDRCRRYGPAGALLLLDLDHFKAVNDRLGHAVGDLVLAGIAAELRARVRTSDVVARLGGDEFAVLLPVAADPVGVAEDLVGAVERAATSAAEALPASAQGDADVVRAVGGSIGVASVTEALLDVSLLLRAADEQMYRDKRRKRGATEP